MPESVATLKRMASLPAHNPRNDPRDVPNEIEFVHARPPTVSTTGARLLDEDTEAVSTTTILTFVFAVGGTIVLAGVSYYACFK